MSLSTKIQIVLILTWFGVVLGISFLEAPVKFHTPSLTREVALDVGRTVFQALNYFEWVMAFVLGTFIIRTNKLSSNYPQKRTITILYTFICLILFMQSFWLLPELKSRAGLIISGGEPAKNYLHLTYILMEIGKLSLLLVMGSKKLSSV